MTKLAIYGNKPAKKNREIVELPKVEQEPIQPQQEPVNEIEPEETEKEGFGGKIKGFLSNIFD
ncbi:cell division protein FtsA C-terminal domain-containing protein [Vagococcus vulneris]|uniref:cell division protein FtsA C-terminal domain-containing protein n=1 Tax=Vagococcus vulneris TaxID=1977869 RepID=UPI003B836A50